MANCPKGHDSATADYCDVCGTPMAGSGGGPTGPGGGPEDSPPAGQPPGDQAAEAGGSTAGGPAAATPCPACGTPQTGRFCEEDGYDFLLAPPVHRQTADPVSGAVGSAGEAPAVATAAPQGSGQAVSGGPVPAADVAAAGRGTAAGSGWQVVVGADRAYYDVVVGHGGADAGGLTFPRFVTQRRFPLDGQQLLIGRRSRSRGIHPDIDLVGPPEDPGVSHVHALLLTQPTGWAVVDLESANGTYLNDPSSGPIESNTPVPVGDGDRIYLGAWTLLTVCVR